MEIKINRTSLCAADDSLMAMGRYFSINPHENLCDLIEKIKQHSDFSVLFPKNGIFEIWHLQVQGIKVATVTSINNQIDIAIINQQQLGDIFSTSNSLYLKRDIDAIKTYQFQISKNKEKEKINKSIARNKTKKN